MKKNSKANAYSDFIKKAILIRQDGKTFVKYNGIDAFVHWNEIRIFYTQKLPCPMQMNAFPFAMQPNRIKVEQMNAKRHKLTTIHRIIRE